MTTRFDSFSVHEAYITWSIITAADPGDPVATHLINAIGPVPALAWLDRAACDPETPPPFELVGADAAAESRHAADWRVRAGQWVPALRDLDLGRILGEFVTDSSGVLTPAHAAWPAHLRRKPSFRAPLALWYRGDLGLLGGCVHVDPSLEPRHIGIDGMSACTEYGAFVAGDLVGDMPAHYVPVTTEAFGIADKVVHSALIRDDDVRPVVVAACGPNGSHGYVRSEQLDTVARSGGLVVSMVPPSATATRGRVLARRHLLSQLSDVVVVIEGTGLSHVVNASVAQATLTPLGAVPGPITSSASVLPHRLIRYGAAMITSFADIEDLAAQIETGATDEH